MRGPVQGCRILAVAGRSKRRQLQRRSAQAEKCLLLWRLMEKLNDTEKERGHLVKETQAMESRRGGRRRSKSRKRHFKEWQTDHEMGWVPSQRTQN